MSSSQTSSSSPLPARCLTCGREFETEQVVLLGRTFAAERYCEICRAAEEAGRRAARVVDALGTRGRPIGLRRLHVRELRARGRHRDAAAVCKQWVEGVSAPVHDLRQRSHPPRRPGAGKTHLAIAILHELVWSDASAQRALHQRSAVAQRPERELRRRRAAAESERLRHPRARRPRRRGLVVAVDARPDLPDPSTSASRSSCC